MVTKRFTSNQPGLLNISYRTELGRLVRERYMPQTSTKELVISVDSTQVELILLAELSGVRDGK